MAHAVPQEWIDSLVDAMELFDVEARPDWRPVIEADARIVIGMWVADHAAPGIMMNAEFTALPDQVWQQYDSAHVLYALADILGRLRGDGIEDMTPVREGHLLAGLGLVTAEVNPREHLTSNSFYLHDRLGNFLTRRFMGGNQGEPQTTLGYVSPHQDEEAVREQAWAHPHFTDVHAALSTLLHACAAPPAQCRQTFGPNTYPDLATASEMLANILTLFGPDITTDPKRLN